MTEESKNIFVGDSTMVFILHLSVTYLTWKRFRDHLLLIRASFASFPRNVD